MRRNLSLLATLTLAFVLVGFVMLGNLRPATAAPAGYGSMTIDWNAIQNTLAELHSKSDAIALVRVLSVDAPRVVGPATAGTPGTFFTDSHVEVVRTYKGILGPDIVIMQTGGVLGRQRQESQEAPLLWPGQSTLVFLKDISNDPVQAPGQRKFRILGPSGRFDLTGGGFVTYVSTDVTMKYRGRALEQIEADIRSLGK
jgi:hypothetical protein